MCVLVRNIKGRTNSEVPPGYESWLHYWETQKGIKAIDCLNSDCENSAEVVAHVGLISRDDIEYILPVCFKCNNDLGKKFYINGSYLVELK